MHRIFTARRLALLGTLAAPAVAHAQNLGPFRQFLSVEPYYVSMSLDDGGSGAGRTTLSGVGGRLWINYAPFVRSRTLAKGGVALFYHQTFAKDGILIRHYGAEQDAFLTNRPFGGWLDPVLSVGAGALRTSVGAQRIGTTAIPASVATKFALTPGVGVRIPIPNRLQLRVDARDALVFGATGADGAKRTASNFEFTGAIGLTF